MRAHEWESATVIHTDLLGEQFLENDVTLLEIRRIDVGDIIGNDLLPQIRRSESAPEVIEIRRIHDLFQHRLSRLLLHTIIILFFYAPK